MDLPKRSQPHMHAANSFNFTLHPVRPLLHFGQRMTVGLSTAVSFDPDTVLKAACGRSFTYLFKQIDYGSYLAFQAWLRSITRGSAMQNSTRATLAKVFTPVDGINRRPLLDELAMLPNALTNSWRVLFRTTRTAFEPTWRRMLVRLAARDRALHGLSRMDAEQNVALRRKLFLPSLNYWESTALFGNSFRPVLVLDATLEHLAWVDLQLSRSGQTVLRTDPIIGLVCPGKVPMRHWFDRILYLSGKPNLAALCDLLAERADPVSLRHFTHVKLKQWATASKRMASGPACRLLEALQPQVDLGREGCLLWIASMLSFLISFVQAFATEPVDRVVAQTAIHSRLMALRDDLLTN